MSFTAKYPEVFEQGELPLIGTNAKHGFLKHPKHKHLDMRFERLFDAQPQCWKNQNVLEMACHNGRWAMAALASGASHVDGFDIQQDYANTATKICGKRFPEDKFRFWKDDFRDANCYMKREAAPGQYDTITCLGLLYHLYDRLTVFQLVAGLKPKYFIVETFCMEKCEDQPMVRLNFGTDKNGAMEEKSLPNIKAVKTLADYVGFKIEHQEHFKFYRTFGPMGKKMLPQKRMMFRMVPR